MQFDKSFLFHSLLATIAAYPYKHINQYILLILLFRDNHIIKFYANLSTKFKDRITEFTFDQ